MRRVSSRLATSLLIALCRFESFIASRTAPLTSRLSELLTPQRKSFSRPIEPPNPAACATRPLARPLNQSSDDEEKTCRVAFRVRHCDRICSALRAGARPSPPGLSPFSASRRSRTSRHLSRAWSCAPSRSARGAGRRCGTSRRVVRMVARPAPRDRRSQTMACAQLGIYRQQRGQPGRRRGRRVAASRRHHHRTRRLEVDRQEWERRSGGARAAAIDLRRNRVPPRGVTLSPVGG